MIRDDCFQMINNKTLNWNKINMMSPEWIQSVKSLHQTYGHKIYNSFYLMVSLNIT